MPVDLSRKISLLSVVFPPPRRAQSAHTNTTEQHREPASEPANGIEIVCSRASQVAAATATKVVQRGKVAWENCHRRRAQAAQ